jgi:hypothetical protein
MIFGQGTFAIAYDGGLYVPTTATPLIPDVENQNLQSRSRLTTAAKVRALATYFNASARVKRISAADIAYFRTIAGQEVRLYPHIDIPGISYYVSVVKAEIKFEDGNPRKPYVDLKFAGVYNVEIFTEITAKRITVTAPDSATWVRDYEFEITWTSVSIAAIDLVKIELYKSGSLDSVISASTANDGSFLWTIPADQVAAPDYAIRITQVSDVYVYGVSGSLSIATEYWKDHAGDYVLDENGNRIPIN